MALRAFSMTQVDSAITGRQGVAVDERPAVGRSQVKTKLTDK